MKKQKKLTLVLIALLVLVLTCWAIAYVNDYYHADAMAIAILDDHDNEHSAMHIEMLDEDALAFIPDNPKAAFIFYPGGKVEYTAYAPLMKRFAEHGVLCILPEMPGNLAVLDMQAAKRYRNRYPDVDKWYIGGHSLGGSMAANCVREHVDEYEGLILLAAYSTVDLSGTDLQVISVYGSEDGVLDMEKYREYKSNLPIDAQELVIDGGCHAFFGSYGTQEGDGVPKISNEEQWRQTVTYCLDKMQLENE